MSIVSSGYVIPCMMVGSHRHHIPCSTKEAEWIPLPDNMAQTDVALAFILNKPEYRYIAEIYLCPHCDMSRYPGLRYSDIMRSIKRIKALTPGAKLCEFRPGMASTI